MENVQVFKNEQFGEIRTVTIENEPWFVAADVCKALDLGNPSQALVRLEEDERSSFNLGRQGEANLINEPGLYSLVLGSRKKEAKAFKRWVTHDVLPTIRKHGVYATQELLDNPDVLIAALQELKAEREVRKQLQTENHQQKQIIGELKPKADYTDRILQSKSLMTITQIAKDYGMSGRAFNEILRKIGVQFKQGTQWLLYAKYHGKGFTHSETVEIVHNDGRHDVTLNTKWTQKGRLFLYELLKSKGIVPVIEQDL